MISKKLRNAVKLHPEKQYRLAWRVGMNPTTLSQFMTGYSRPKYGDPRVIAIGKLVGLKPEECFSTKQTERDIGNGFNNG